MFCTEPSRPRGQERGLTEAMRETVGRGGAEFREISIDATVNTCQSIMAQTPGFGAKQKCLAEPDTDFCRLVYRILQDVNAHEHGVEQFCETLRNGFEK